MLKQLPLVAGILGGSFVLFNRLLLTPELATSQSRSDALGIILSAVLILTGLLWQQIQPRPPDLVELEGTSQCVWDDVLLPAPKLELAWATHTILTCSPIRAVVIWWDSRAIVRRGILPDTAPREPGSLAERVMRQQKSVYLVALKLYPARVEFDYLPANTQSVLCQPLGDRGVIVCATDTPRNLTQSDQIWLSAIAAKLAVVLDVIEANPQE